MSEELGASILSAMKTRSLPGVSLPVQPGRTTRIHSRSVPDRARCRASPPIWTPQDPDKRYLYDYQDPQAFCGSPVADPTPEIMRPWTWPPTDLTEGAPFYSERLQTLRRVLATPFYATRSDLGQLWNDALTLLALNRLNYSP
jgi:hypothetical protein